MSEETPILEIKNFKLKGHEKKVADLFLAGESNRDIGLKVFEARIKRGDLKPESSYIKVLSILRKPRVKEYLEYNEKIIREQLVNQQVWNKTHSVYELKKLIDINSHEQQRVARAIQDELECLMAEIEEAQEDGDDKKCRELMKKLHSKQQRMRLSKVSNEAILGSVSELNKMHGYNQENIAYTETVLFEDLELED